MNRSVIAKVALAISACGVVVVANAMGAGQIDTNTSVRDRDASWFVRVAVNSSSDAEAIEAKLRGFGFDPVRNGFDSSSPFELLLGPFASHEQATQVRDQLTSKGYQPSLVMNPGSASSHAGDAAEETSAQSSLEAQALAKTFGGQVPQDPNKSSNLESQALQAMAQHTAENQVETEQAQQRIEGEERQLEIQRQQTQSQQASSTRAASVFNGISAVLGAANDAMASAGQPTTIEGAKEQGLVELNATYARDQQLKAQQDAQLAAQRAQQQAALAAQEVQRLASQQQQTASQNLQQNLNGKCPNGEYVDTAAQCDCRNHSASIYPCGGFGGSAQQTGSPSGMQQNTGNTPTNGSLSDGSSGSETTSPSAGTTKRLPPGTGCNDATSLVSVTGRWLTGAGHCGGEVVGSMTNKSGEWVTCTTAFHKNGIWTEYEQGPIGPGKTHVGEMEGFWTCGADSSQINYVCFAGKDPLDVNGNYCGANLKF